MTPEREQEIRDSIPTVYGPPWTVHPNMEDSTWHVMYATDHPLAGLVAVVPDYGAHLAEFIAAARAAIPELLAEVDRLRDKLIKAATDDVLRAWSAKIREVGTAKGWSVWAAAFLDPDVEFIDTDMPSTETIVAELRRLDRVAVLREAADMVHAMADPRCHCGGCDSCAARGYADQLRRIADGEVQEKSTRDGSQPTVGIATPAPAALLAHATAFEVPRPGNLVPLLLQRSYAGGDRWAICDREGRRWDRDGGWMYEGQHLDERTRTDTRFPLAEAWPLAHRIAAREPVARATVAPMAHRDETAGDTSHATHPEGTSQ
ncbi:hypothetical protein [Streptomyces umbrinus]|uniref:hypothetical protein n=1 Tax=Streptomyces umbrinus TaxID=67370 RepID=UPI0034265FBB